MVFEDSPISIGEEDFSGVKRYFDDLKKEGVTDLKTYFFQHPETIRQCVALIKIVDINWAAVVLHAAAKKDELMAGLVNTFTPELFDTFQQILICLWNGEIKMTRDTLVRTFAGEHRNVTLYFSVCPGYEQTLSKVLVSFADIRTQTGRSRNSSSIRNWKRAVARTARLEAATKELEAFAIPSPMTCAPRDIDGFIQMPQTKRLP
jgi:hypothetical protein